MAKIIVNKTFQDNITRSFSSTNNSIRSKHWQHTRQAKLIEQARGPLKWELLVEAEKKQANWWQHRQLGDDHHLMEGQKNEADEELQEECHNVGQFKRPPLYLLWKTQFGFGIFASSLLPASIHPRQSDQPTLRLQKLVCFRTFFSSYCRAWAYGSWPQSHPSTQGRLAFLAAFSSSAGSRGERKATSPRSWRVYLFFTLLLSSLLCLRFSLLLS